MALGDSVGTLPPTCTVFGGATGDPAAAFECAASASPEFVSALWASLATAAFMALWLRLVWQAWQQYNKKKYEIKDLANIIVWPPALYIFAFLSLSNF